MTDTDEVPIHPNDMGSDAAKLLALARWLDQYDHDRGNPDHEVQDDLRRIAKRLAKLDGQQIRWPT